MQQDLTIRPVGARVVAYVVAVALIVMTVVIGWFLPEDITFSFSELVTLALVLGATLALLHGVGRSVVKADDAGVHVLNGYRRHDLAWSDVAGFSMNTGAPWPTLVTRDDERVMLFAIQRSDGQGVRGAVGELERLRGEHA